MADNGKDGPISAGRLVVPVAMIAGLLGAAWFGGVEHSRLNTVEATQRQVLIRIEEQANTIQRLQLVLERHQSQSDETQRMLKDILAAIKKP